MRGTAPPAGPWAAAARPAAAIAAIKEQSATKAAAVRAVPRVAPRAAPRRARGAVLTTSSIYSLHSTRSAVGTFMDSLRMYFPCSPTFREIGLVRVGELYGVSPKRRARIARRSMWKGSLTRMTFEDDRVS